MAANRQTRALAFNGLARHNGTGGALARQLCAALRGGASSASCSLHLARRALYQFSFIGLNSKRCAVEKLFEAQFGLRFGERSAVGIRARAASRGGQAHADVGKGAHKVEKLAMADLPASEQALVRQLNRDDLALYAEAESLFHARLKAYGIPREVRCH